MIWILLYLVITIITILVCYFDAKKYHYTIKLFLSECLLSLIFPLSIMFLLSKLYDYFEIKLHTVNLDTDFITKFLNKKL
jgi:hypothetical protein